MKRVFVFTLLGALSACSPAKSVTNYKAHAAERRVVVDDCLGGGTDSLDCRNARQAEFETLGLPAKDGSAIVASVKTRPAGK